MADLLTGTDLDKAIRQVRLLLNDVDEVENDRVFSDVNITDFLELEGWVVKLAAAQAIDTNASNEVLASKVLRTDSGVQTDGAKVADAMRKHAAALRAQVVDEDEAGDGFFFEVIDLDGGACRTERTAYPLGY